MFDRSQSTDASSIAAKPDVLAVKSGGGDLALVMLVAHEIRKARARDALFLELRRERSDTPFVRIFVFRPMPFC